MAQGRSTKLSSVVDSDQLVVNKELSLSDTQGKAGSAPPLAKRLGFRHGVVGRPSLSVLSSEIIFQGSVVRIRY